MYTFATPTPVNLRVEVWEGSITVIAEDTDTTTIELVPESGRDAAEQLVDAATVEQRGDEIVVLFPKARGGLFRRGHAVRATIHVPRHSSARLASSSADIKTGGELGDVTVSSGSGDVQLDQVGAAEVRAGSGDVMVDQVGGPLTVKSGSGDVHVRSSGDSVDALAGSGDVVLKRVAHGRISAKTGSGDVAIGVPAGTAAYLDIMTVSGDVRSGLDDAEGPGNGESTIEITVKSGSGDVVLQRA